MQITLDLTDRQIELLRFALVCYAGKLYDASNKPAGDYDDCESFWREHRLRERDLVIAIDEQICACREG